MIAWLVFLGMFGLVCAVVLDLFVELAERKISSAAIQLETPLPADTVVVKIAYYVPPPTPVPTDTPAPALTPTRNPTLTPSRTWTPAPKPTSVPASLTQQSRADSRSVVNLSTPLPAIAAVIPTPVAPVVSLGESYGLLQVLSPATDHPAEHQADLNLTLRGYAPVSATLALVEYAGDTDGGAPQLVGLLAERRMPAFSAAFRVYDWNWGCNCRGSLLEEPDVTLVAIKTRLGEIIRVPGAGASIGNGYQALVLYADAERIALKYTRADNVKQGYTVHIESIQVDSALLALYRRANDAGRGELPALRAGQAFGKAKGGEIRVAIRDTGTFLDPRSRKDWWREF